MRDKCRFFRWRKGNEYCDKYKRSLVEKPCKSNCKYFKLDTRNIFEKLMDTGHVKNINISNYRGQS